LPLSAIAAEPVESIDMYVHPYFDSAKGPDGKPQVAVGKTFDGYLSSNRRDDIVAAADLVRAKPELITPMTMMVLAIRLYDLGLRDDSVFWFYAAKDRYLTLSNVVDVAAAGLSEVESAIGAFAELAGPVINGYAFCDPKKQEATELSAIDWVEANPYQVILMDSLPAKPGDRGENLKAAIGHLKENAEKARAYLDDPKNLATFEATRKANDADAKFCWQ
jgi:hypothetical protein